MSDENNGRLVSWKEIAAYLCCDVRTCLRWEKERGLPVYRPGGQPGPRVMAWKHELDAWLAGKPQPGTEKAAPRETIASPVERGSMSRTWAFVAALIIILGGLAYLGIRALTMDREPADFRIEGSRLFIQNKAKRDLWNFNTELKDLCSEAEYRARFQIRRVDKEDAEADISPPPVLSIEDLNGDGRKEVLFVPRSESGAMARKLYCFDEHGRELWLGPFEGGRELVFGEKLFSRNYSAAFETYDLDGDGRLEILAFFAQITDWPTQLVILTWDGRVLGEYWNSGRITATALADLDGDGRRNLLIGGVNNQYKKAFIAVFDPSRISGASPNSGEFRCSALSPGSELAYILLPWTDIDPVADIKTVLCSVSVLDNGRIRGQISRTSLQFDLDPETLACLDLTYGLAFKLAHQTKVRKGEIQSNIDSTAYGENLKRGFLYWTGREWTSTPTWVSQRP